MAYVSLGLGLLRTPLVWEDFTIQNDGNNGSINVEGGENQHQNIKNAEI